jgi:hypothetical protein
MLRLTCVFVSDTSGTTITHLLGGVLYLLSNHSVPLVRTTADGWGVIDVTGATAVGPGLWNIALHPSHIRVGINKSANTHHAFEQARLYDLPQWLQNFPVAKTSAPHFLH